MQLKLDMSCHLLNVYTKFQIDISKHVEEKSGKRGRTDGRTDGQTDGRTDIATALYVPFFKRAYKNIGHINHIRNKKSGFPPYFIVNNKHMSWWQNIADRFREYFSQIGVTLAGEIDTGNTNHYLIPACKVRLLLISVLLNQPSQSWKNHL